MGLKQLRIGEEARKEVLERLLAEIASLREKDMSYRKIGEAMGIKWHTVYSLDKGRRGLSIKMAEKILRQLGDR